MKKQDDQDPLNGTRIRLTYYDSEGECSWLLPRTGTVIGCVPAKDGKRWALLQLDSPAVDPQSAQHTQVLVHSRWAGYTVGGRDPTSAFVFRVVEPLLAGFEATYENYITWAMASTESEP